MTATPLIDVPLRGKNGLPVAWVKARFVRSDDQLTGHWETSETLCPLTKTLWATSGYVKLMGHDGQVIALPAHLKEVGE